MTNHLDRSILEETIENIVQSCKCIAPIASIIIVTHKTKKETIASIINKLKGSSDHLFEILLIDNNRTSDLVEIAKKEELFYIKLKENYGITTGRNVGIIKARGDILVFLDDDAMPGEKFIDEHIKAHRNYRICALRGKCLPLTDSIFNYFATHYDLGDEVFPYGISLEGNSSFKKEILKSVGGFNSLLKGGAGHEGIEISNRIIQKTKDAESIIYYPGAVIYHDYSRTLLHYLKKQLRHENHYKYIVENSPGFSDLYTSMVQRNKKGMKKPNFGTRIQIGLILKMSKCLRMLNSIVKKKVKIDDNVPL